MSWHRQYRGQTTGRVLHFLYHYCGFNVSEQATIGKNTVHYFGRKIATYEWLNEKDDIPIFKFISDPDGYPRDGSKEYERNQKERMFEAITDQNPPTEECKNCRDIQRELKMIKSIYGIKD